MVVFKHAIVILSLLFLASCSSVELTPAGNQVKIVETVDKECESLGLIAGEGGSSWKGGAYYKNSSLIQYAQNDMRNKAAANGATHMVIKTSNFGHTSGGYGGGTVTGANLTGTAYRCPPAK